MNFLIIESDDGKTFTAYAETGERLCSDNNYQDCLIKCGLLGLKMNPVPPNSWAAERIREKAQFYGRD